MVKRKVNKMEYSSEYLSPRELAYRWQLSRSRVGRIAIRAGFKALYLGDGKISSVRYLMEEVIAYERSRQISLT